VLPSRNLAGIPPARCPFFCVGPETFQRRHIRCACVKSHGVIYNETPFDWRSLGERRKEAATDGSLVVAVVYLATKGAFRGSE
jgi:hypothetical protein